MVRRTGPRTPARWSEAGLWRGMGRGFGRANHRPRLGLQGLPPAPLSGELRVPQGDAGAAGDAMVSGQLRIVTL